MGCTEEELTNQYKHNKKTLQMIKIPEAHYHIACSQLQMEEGKIVGIFKKHFFILMFLMVQELKPCTHIRLVFQKISISNI